VPEQPEQRLADVAVRARDDRGHVAVVGLERVLLLAGDAALDAEHDDDDQEQRDAQADGLSYAHRLPVRPPCGVARRALPTTASSGAARTWLTCDACG